MRVFISGLSGYFGATLAGALASVEDAPTITETLADADAVVIDLHGPLSEAVAIVKDLRCGPKKGTSRSIVCVSSVQTWGRTPAGRRRDGDDPPLLREDNFTSRKPTPGFSHMKSVESQVLSLRSDTTRVTVVAAGVLYGNGEGPMHSIFKAAWSCAPLGIPAFKGGARNFVPAIHVQHLAHAVAKMIATPPERSYVVAVDDSQNTLREVMQAIGGALNAGASMRALAEEDSDRLLLDDQSMSALQLDLRFDLTDGGLAALDLGEEATCRGGIVENIDEVVSQFLKHRDLRSVRVVILAPPAAGAEFYVNSLAEKYCLPRVDGASAVREFLSAFAVVADADADAGGDNGGADTDMGEREGHTELTAHQVLAKEINESEDASDLSILQLATVVRWKLRTPPCQNQGYVLTGVPASFAAAVATFCAESSVEQAPEPDGTEDLASMGEVDPAIVPRSVIILDAPDEWLRLRAEGVEHKSAVGAVESSGNTFTEELSAFREAHDAGNEKCLASYFEVACKLETLSLQVNSHSEKEILEMMGIYVEKGGRPYNYHPTEEESRDLLRQQADSKLQENEVRLASARSGAVAAQARQVEREANDLRRLDEVEKREAELLETRSLPLRNYLMAHVMPTLTQGLVDVCKVRPADPVDYLAARRDSAKHFS